MKRCALLLLTTVLLTVVLLMVLAASPVAASSESTSCSVSPSETTPRRQESFDSKSKLFPWYSPREKKLVFIPPAPEKETPDLPAQTPRSHSVFMDLLTRIAAMALLAFLILLLAWALYKIFIRKRQNNQDDQLDERDRQRRLDTLLPEVRKEIDHLLAAAQSAYGEGNLVRALICYFSHFLIELDKHGLLHLHRGKTNHDYAAELRPVPDFLALYEPVMALFERTYYGNYPLAPTEFEQVWKNRIVFAERIEQLEQSRRAGTVKVISTKLLIPFLCLACLTTTGCHRYWSERYVAYLPPNGSDQSINGDALFRKVISDQKYSIKTFGRLPYHNDRYDTIVWFRNLGETTVEPDAAEWFQHWLQNEPETDTKKESWPQRVNRFLFQKNKSKTPGMRTLVIVEYSYQANVDFWQAMYPVTPVKDRPWVQQQLDFARKEESTLLLSPIPHDPNDLTEALKRLAKTIRPEKIPSADSDPFEEIPDEIIPDETTHDSPEETMVRNEDIFKKIMKTIREEYREIEVKAQEKKDALWFRNEQLDKITVCDTVTGSETWPCSLSEDSWRVAHRLVPLQGTEVLLKTGKFPLVLHRQEGTGHVYIVAGGGFLLNYPLLHSSRQELASELVDRFSQQGRKVLFFQGKFQAEEGKAEVTRSRFDLSRFSPFSLLFWQGFFLFLFIIFWKMPIFGRPHRIPSTRQTDFNRHIDAYARLLKNTGNRDWARRQIDEYNQQLQSDHPES